MANRLHLISEQQKQATFRLRLLAWIQSLVKRLGVFLFKLTLDQKFCELGNDFPGNLLDDLF